MKSAAMVLTSALTFAGSAWSQSAAVSSGLVNTKVPPVATLLQQGYEVKTGFVDSAGIAYLVMQKSTSAYLCHSGAVPACDKLN